MPVPVTPWQEWIESVPALAPHREAIADAVGVLRSRHPARRAFWGDDFAWELAAADLDDAASAALAAAARHQGVLRLEVNAEPLSPPNGQRSTVRSVLLASTPRTGNTIVRQLIVQLGFAEYALHDLDDLHWQAAVRPYVVQNHIGPGERALRFVSSENARAVTVVRHPLDVLCSVRAFSQREPACRYWLDGMVDLAGRDLTTDGSFLAWATGAGANALLTVSTAWAERDDVIVVRYEDLVDDMSGVLQHLADSLGVTTADVTAASADDAAQAIPAIHRTSGGPGAWLDLPESIQHALLNRHRRHIETLGYGGL